jgi:BASS family bile acid:Na+ symporter
VSILLVVIPVLVLLMFGLGLQLHPADFARVVRRPRAAAVGLSAQLLALPLVAAGVAAALDLPPVLAVGLVLLAACPGGASSNAITMLARGDVALSVTLTAVTSVITVATIPVVVNLAMAHWLGTGSDLRLALAPVLGQNTATILVPIAAGMLLRARRRALAVRLAGILRRATLPLLLAMIAVFLIDQRAVLSAVAGRLVLATALLVAGTMALGALLGRLARLQPASGRAILVEVGIQNAAQAMAIAGSPLLLADFAYAVPAVVHVVSMNLAALTYVAWARTRPLPRAAAPERP